MKKAYLILENGRVFPGYRCGAEGEVSGELVFTTGMGGYIETLTDPSYYGQIILQTFPVIGNYGWIAADQESPTCHARGYVVRELCGAPSNFRSEGTVDAFLKEQGVPGICGVDTRTLTQLLREQGVMAARISSTPDWDPAALADYRIENAVAAVSCKEVRHYPADQPRLRVALIDYGAKGNIIRELNQRGCTVLEMPYNSTAEQILALAPQGALLSNGPGDPAENTEAIAVIRELLGKIPMFGVCLGHQLLALAREGATMKLKYGHRGANQPVRDLATGQVLITSQNHGYAVDMDSIHGKGRVSFVNANDGTCEGVNYPEQLAFSVQFHPEACSGPQDTRWLFDDFIALMEGDAHALK